MSDVISIEKSLKRFERILARIEAKLDREELAKGITEEEAAEYCGYTVGTFRNKISDGTIKANAIIETEGKKRFRLEKLIKK